MWPCPCEKLFSFRLEFLYTQCEKILLPEWGRLWLFWCLRSPNPIEAKCLSHRFAHQEARAFIKILSKEKIVKSRKGYTRDFNYTCNNKYDKSFMVKLNCFILYTSLLWMLEIVHNKKTYFLKRAILSPPSSKKQE